MRTLASILVSLSLALCACQGLDQDTLQRLRIDPWRSSVQPGDEVQFQVGTWECCTYFDEVPVAATWRLEPAGYLDIGLRSGRLQVPDNAPDWWHFTVIADLEYRQRILTADVFVYTPETNPLVGTWQEVGQLDCATGEEIEPAHGGRLLTFEADGSFAAKWPGREATEYWGWYAFDQGSGSLLLGPTGSNHLPDDFQGTGSFRLEADGSLTLHAIWLGNERFEQVLEARCGHHLGLTAP